jgi:hypothetical protein
MATRSRIGIQLADESVLSVYHHWDGYPEWLGRILNTHYNSKELAAELIDGGDMSCCWTDERWTDESIKLNPFVAQENPPTIYRTKAEYGPQYYSQRGDDCPPRYDVSVKTYLETGEEYAYLYTLNGEWVCWNRHEFEENPVPTIAEIPSAALAV